MFGFANQDLKHEQKFSENKLRYLIVVSDDLNSLRVKTTNLLDASWEISKRIGYTKHERNKILRQSVDDNCSPPEINCSLTARNVFFVFFVKTTAKPQVKIGFNRFFWNAGFHVD